MSIIIDIQVCKWFVFELVALLTMLLLLSLGIFVLGLCLFTAAVRVVVGRTTHTTVVLWATFFALALLTPSDLVMLDSFLRLVTSSGHSTSQTLVYRDRDILVN